ncbi:5-dehydro-4-deoxy-D-glucuronate isomerase [Flavihumibacter sp. CACIAM 22H1]|uniref:5-dehydro-4-deoxy-D-glucuronate isomerase n=1 Tax=Flavihumibacter sp. CACIAM 22H1 TaxID=1812911 RepID=UPI0007A80E0E|nr:5-dehydro-4-deoxy-D-glucuronate isomerase [Flavihumibacter sp. CACIAM 22H1]KYP16203.1 MAG: 5-keto-4-deoxyuronate isomerase [Flavihumibacter sp. CACIAM 22H1]
MEIRFQHSPNETRNMGTDALRQHFLIKSILQPSEVKLVYTHYDRVIIGGIQPGNQPLQLPAPAELRASFFLERREAGIINVGGKGIIKAGTKSWELSKLDCLYLGKGTQAVEFGSADPADPALFYLLSSPAHMTYPDRLMKKEDVTPVQMGATATCNQRTIYKYIFEEGIQSCQLVMGLTIIAEGSVWNTMPAHTHTRRMEAYFYFDMEHTQRVFHFMGEPQETRHLLVASQDAVISPPWSIHAGCGTANYSFIWGMAGENYTYTDMDPAPADTLL